MVRSQREKSGNFSRQIRIIHCRGNDSIKKCRMYIINIYQGDLIIKFENDLIKMSNID